MMHSKWQMVWECLFNLVGMFNVRLKILEIQSWRGNNRIPEEGASQRDAEEGARYREGEVQSYGTVRRDAEEDETDGETVK
ncbi:hypothetical protein E3N88_25006 [Mikania micrantha]|uniref:Uncharacterized protein n=1 Tax=Mikania micrantha TaxID=192012 RepID=A0A5N6N6E5_9ASTR|nr:hypothetical protein E3N88_25006 [Mikania micrantha]